MSGLEFSSRRAEVYARRAMVASSQPLAVGAGLDALKAGGTAADACIAAAGLLAVTEPMMTGPGGDCFALHYDAASGELSALNGSGRSAAAASREALLAAGHARMPELGGPSVTVPGAVAGWSELLARHGRMGLAEALRPAIAAAADGYPVSGFSAGLWAEAAAKLLRGEQWAGGQADPGPPQPSGGELLLEGRAPRPGELMRLPELAETLRGIAAEGPAFVYRGLFAEKLAAHVQRYGGWLTPADLAAHESRWETPISTRYRDVLVHQCPPNGQGLAALLALRLAGGYELAAMPALERVHTLIECMRLGFADALRWVADPAFAPLPVAALLGEAYTEARRALIDPRRAAAEVAPGDPQGFGDTSYVTAVDEAGNACSFINSVFRSFGTGLVVPGTGVCLHNRGALFSLEASHPNALEPGKRPYQTIIPAISTWAEGPRAGALHASFGVVGGQMQPQAQLQILVHLLDLGLPPQAALDALRWQLSAIAPGQGPQPTGAAEPGGLCLLEAGWDQALAEGLANRGHRLQHVAGRDRISFGGAQLILRDPATGVLTGASEPRFDGLALGY